MSAEARWEVTRDARPDDEAAVRALLATDELDGVRAPEWLADFPRRVTVALVREGPRGVTGVGVAVRLYGPRAQVDTIPSGDARIVEPLLLELAHRLAPDGVTRFVVDLAAGDTASLEVLEDAYACEVIDTGDVVRVTFAPASRRGDRVRRAPQPRAAVGPDDCLGHAA